jgi:putative ABC transport system permease protein
VSGAAAGSVVVSESFAKRTFRGADPIGRRIRYGGLPTRPWDVIVGVVGDVTESSLAGDKGSAFYLPMEQSWADNPMWLVVRARGDAAALAPAVRNAIWSIDKDQPIVRVATMAQLVDASEAKRRFTLIVFECFASVALTLAAIGIYGVLAGSVTERTREIGVRSALGASRRDIVALILEDGMMLAGAGVAIGLIAAAAASRALATLLFGVSRVDSATYAAVAALIFGVAAVACAVPAWRAARIDPSITLRVE